MTFYIKNKFEDFMCRDGGTMIKHISIQNFRSIENISLDFEDEKENLICFIGKNGSGKSNIFKAINYFFKYINEFHSKEKIIDSSNPYVQKCIISILFDLKLLESKASQNKELSEKFDEIGELLNKDNDFNLKANHDLKLTMTQFRDGTIIWSINNDSICKTLKSIFPLYYIDTRHLDLYTWDKLWHIISDLSTTKPIEDYKSILDSAFCKIYGNKYSLSKSYIESAFDNIGISLDRYNFETRYKSAFSMRFGGDQFMVDGHSLKYYSDGTSSFTYLKLLITLIPKMSDISCKFPIILIDEPEIGLHNDLITEFIQCLNDSIKNKAFCMVSTHSPKFIADLTNNGVNYCIYKINKKGLYSVVNKMNTSWLSDSNHSVTIKETECYFSDYLVYVEGETEIQLFRDPRILELYDKIKKVHFYSFDGNNKRLRMVHSKNLNLGIPYKIIIDMDKILRYSDDKKKFNIHSEQALNPLANNSLKKSELFCFYKSPQTNSGIRSELRNQISSLINEQYDLASGKNYIDDENYNKLMALIIKLCGIYNIIVNWSTIEGCIITYENIGLFIDYLNEKVGDFQKTPDLYALETDLRERSVLILSEFNGKTEVFKKAKFNKISVRVIVEKTDGWISKWLDHYFKKIIDPLNSLEEKREKFKSDFPQLHNTLQTIENMI